MFNFRRLFFGILFFTVFYRLNLFNSGVSINLILGIIIILISFLNEKINLLKKSLVRLMFFSIILLIYSIFIDLYLVNDIISVNSFFSMDVKKNHIYY